MALYKSRRIRSRRKRKNQFIILTFIALLILFSGLFFLFKFTLRKINDHLNRKAIQKTASVKRRAVYKKLEKTIYIPILMYHYVEYVKDTKDTIRQSLNINPYLFEEQIKTLSEAKYTFLTARDLGRVLDGKRPLPPKPILITIDDGHWDLDTDILPILQKYNAHATAYIISGFLNTSDFLSTKQLQHVIDSGLVEIGAHTVHHAFVKNASLKTIVYEIEESKKMLEETFGIEVTSFAYPSGYYDLQSVQVVENAGFVTAMSTNHGTEVNQENRYYLNRLRPGGRVGEGLLMWLAEITLPKNK